MPIKRTDLIQPEILAEAVSAELAGRPVLYGSPAVVTNTSLPGDKRGGDTVTVPYFGTMGELEDVAEGQALTLRTLSMSSETAQVQRSGMAFSITKWAELAAQYADPYAEAAKQVANSVQRRFVKALIDVAKAPGASLAVHDVYNAGTPVNFSWDVVVDAKQDNWGDEQDDLALMASHSKVKGDLYKAKDTTGRTLYVDPATPGQLGMFCGMPITWSDRIAPSSDTPPKYSTLLLKERSLVLWMGAPEIESGPDILSHTTVTAVNIYFVAYRYKRLMNGTKKPVIQIVHN